MTMYTHHTRSIVVNRDWTELLMVLLVVGFLIGTCLVIVSALGPPVEDTFEPVQYPPEIPQCDEPLWDRVKDRCV